MLEKLEIVKRRDSNISFQSFLRSLEGDSSAIFRICKTLQNPSSCLSHHSPLLIGEELTYNLDRKAQEFAKSVANPNYPEPDRISTAEEKSIKRKFLDKIDKLFIASEEVVIPLSSVASAFSSLQHRSPGADCIELSHLEMLDKLPLLSYLKRLFEVTINTRMVPHSFRSSIALPIPKRGKPAHKAESWRPIHLIDIVGKLYEKVLLPLVISAVENYLSPRQFAYRRGLSTELALRSTLDTLRATPRSIMVNFDLSRAFERVN